MAAINPNYHKHYRGFCERLKADPTIKFGAYCAEAGVPWRRLYDWMKRRHISLRRLYAGYDQPVPETEKTVVDSGSEAPLFAPLETDVSPSDAVNVTCRSLQIRLPNGVSLEIGECDAVFLTSLLGGPLGKCRV